MCRPKLVLPEWRLFSRKRLTRRLAKDTTRRRRGGSNSRSSSKVCQTSAPTKLFEHSFSEFVSLKSSELGKVGSPRCSRTCGQRLGDTSARQFRANKWWRRRGGGQEVDTQVNTSGALLRLCYRVTHTDWRTVLRFHRILLFISFVVCRNQHRFCFNVHFI